LNDIIDIMEEIQNELIEEGLGVMLYKPFLMPDYFAGK
jgi:hypothetical protein